MPMEHKGDKPEDSEWKVHGYIILAPESTHERVIAWLESMPDCRLIYTKTAHRKRLVLVEEAF
jgi:hypothetical protein